MRKILLPLLLLCALSGAGCPSAQRGDDGAGVASAPNHKTVIILVHEVDGQIKVDVIPDSIPLKKSKNHKLRFTVVNNLEQKINKVEVLFKAENPMDGDLNIGGVDAGNEGNGPRRGIKTSAQVGTYKYGVKVLINGGPTIEIDPEVQIMT